MSLNDKEKLNKIEELKSKLFSRDYQPKIEHHDNFLHRKSREVADSWNSASDATVDLGQKIFTKTSMFKKFFLFSLIFFLLAIGYAAYVFFAGGNTVSNKNIEISVLGNTFTAGGEELPLQIEIVNKNNSALELADLLIEYPKGSSGDPTKDNERMRESLGTIPAGSVRNENLKVVLFGEQGSNREIKISLEYRVEGSNAIFVKDKIHNVSISSSPLDLSIEAPSEVSPNQDITLKVKTTLNATKTASKILLKMDYPVGFQFASANPSPSFGDNVWTLGDLAPGAEREILIYGKMLDVSEGEEKTFHVFSGSQSDSDKYSIGLVYNSLGQTIAIKKPFIDARLYVNGVYQREYATDSKTQIQGEIRWVNNLDTKINDMVINAKITGNALNRSSIKTNQGFYNSVENTIIWDKNFQNGFASVNPGESGTVTFSLSSLPLFGSSSMLSDPSINIEVSIVGKQATEGNAVKSLDNSESKIIKIISDAGLATKTLHSSGPFTNSGPVPMKSEQETTFTVVWSLSNTANNISKAVVTSSLPLGARFIGPISPPSEDLTYNPSTKEITWKIGGIPRGAGITSDEREVAFQIGYLPSLSQINGVPFIINQTVLTGHDDFANVDVRVNKNAMTAKLSDPNAVAGSERVVE